MSRVRWPVLWLLAGASGAGCWNFDDAIATCEGEQRCELESDGGASDSGPADSGAPDAGAPDSGAADSGAPDAGAPDSGAVDSGAPDAGAPDSGAVDSGAPDAGTPDSGAVDSGAPDAGTPDSGQADSGAADSGVPDSGAPDAGAVDAGPPDGGTPFVPACTGRTDAGPARGYCVEGGFCWEFPVPQGSDLLATWGAAWDDAWAVGVGGLVLHFDGTSWSQRDCNTRETLRAIWGTAPDDVWAVGDLGTAVHWDGSTCGVAPTPVTWTLNGVWGIDSEFWAVGNQHTLLVNRGGGWAAAASAPVSTDNFIGVWGSSLFEVYVLPDRAGGLLHRWNGSAWSSTTLPGVGVSTYLEAINGSGPEDINVAGGGGTVVHFDGTAWSPRAVGSWNWYTLASRPGNITVAGPIRSLSWGPFSGPWSSGAFMPGEAFRGAWVCGASDGWVVGGSGQMARWEASEWRLFSPSASVGIANRAWGASDDDIWVAADFRTLMHWNGTAWSASLMSILAPFFGELKAVSGLPDAGAMAVGQQGVVMQLVGGTWTRLDAGTGVDLSSVVLTSANDGWAAGGNGTVLRWDGAAWTPNNPGTPRSLNAVTTMGGEVWVVGDQGTARSFNGSSWTNRDLTTSVPLYDVWADADAGVWAAGGSGNVHRWTGSAWATGSTGTAQTLRAIAGTGPNDVWVAGTQGTVVHFDGGAWTPVPTGTTLDFNAIRLSRDGGVRVFGDNGAVMRFP